MAKLGLRPVRHPVSGELLYDTIFKAGRNIKMMLPKCQCGCGREVARAGSTFLQGHHNRVRSPKTRKRRPEAQGGRIILKSIVERSGKLVQEDSGLQRRA